MKELTEKEALTKFCRGALLAIIESLAKFAKKLQEFKNLDLNDQVSDHHFMLICYWSVYSLSG